MMARSIVFGVAVLALLLVSTLAADPAPQSNNKLNTQQSGGSSKTSKDESFVASPPSDADDEVDVETAKDIGQKFLQQIDQYEHQADAAFLEAFATPYEDADSEDEEHDQDQEEEEQEEGVDPSFVEYDEDESYQQENNAGAINDLSRGFTVSTEGSEAYTVSDAKPLYEDDEDGVDQHFAVDPQDASFVEYRNDDTQLRHVHIEKEEDEIQEAEAEDQAERRDAAAASSSVPRFIATPATEEEANADATDVLSSNDVAEEEDV